MRRYAEKHHYPFYREKSEKNRWFPIGWSCNMYQLGESSDPPPRPGEWKDGTLEHLVENQPWVNTVYCLNTDNNPAWGKPLQKPYKYWSTTRSYIQFLDKLSEIREKYGTDIRALVRVISQVDEYQYEVSGTWDSIPKNGLQELKSRIEAISDHPQLGGFMLADEPFHGDESRKSGHRSSVYQTLLSYKKLIEDYDKNIDHHPIHTVVRGNGNYHFDPENPNQSGAMYVLNELKGIADYIHDDFYLFDFINIFNYTKGEKFLDFTKDRTERARKVLLEGLKEVPNIRNKKAWTLWLQGRDNLGKNSPSSGKSHLEEDELRYQAYCAWINGAQGAFFWELAKSDQLTFRIAGMISKEAHYMSQALLQAPDEISEKSYIDFSDEKDAQFLIRKDPTWFGDGSEVKERYLLMLCNNNKEVDNVFVHLPKSITKVESVIPRYAWSHILKDNNKTFGVGLGGYRARAFFIYF